MIAAAAWVAVGTAVSCAGDDAGRIEQDTRGSCSPAIAEVTGNISITCTASDPAKLATAVERLNDALQRLVRDNVSAREVVAKLDQMIAAQPPSPPPLLSGEIDVVRARGYSLAADLRRPPGPMAASAFMKELKPTADQLWADRRFAEQAPKETALIFRLYAATILLTPGDTIGQARTAEPWLRRSFELGDGQGDRADLGQASSLVNEVASGKLPEVELKRLFGAFFRVAMPGASKEAVESEVDRAISLVPIKGKEDFEFFKQYRIGPGTLGNVMEVMRMTLQARFPHQDVGGQPIFVPMANGSTLVRYVFNGATTQSWEWEVSKKRSLVQPLNDPARSLMAAK